jgi:hypothetical protein
MADAGQIEADLGATKANAEATICPLGPLAGHELQTFTTDLEAQPHRATNPNPPNRRSGRCSRGHSSASAATGSEQARSEQRHGTGDSRAAVGRAVAALACLVAQAELPHSLVAIKLANLRSKVGTRRGKRLDGTSVPHRSKPRRITGTRRKAGANITANPEMQQPKRRQSDADEEARQRALRMLWAEWGAGLAVQLAATGLTPCIVGYAVLGRCCRSTVRHGREETLHDM